MTPYLCEGIMVKTSKGKIGKIININKKTNMLLIRGKSGFYTEKIDNVKIVSYKGVKKCLEKA